MAPSGWYIYALPEALLSTLTGQRLLRSKTYRDNVCCRAVDEAHMIHEWGDNFRKDFSRIQEILGLFPSVPAIVLTTTASPVTQDMLIRDPSLRNPTRINVNPDRQNIKYFKHKRLPSTDQQDDLDQILDEMVNDIKAQMMVYPQTLVYTTLSCIGYAYNYFQSHLGMAQYEGDPLPENRIFAQYHTSYTVMMKNHILAELAKGKSKLWVVFAIVLWEWAWMHHTSET